MTAGEDLGKGVTKGLSSPLVGEPRSMVTYSKGLGVALRICLKSNIQNMKRTGHEVG